MKKLLLLSGFIFILTLNIRGQQKVGFSDPDNIEPLIEYRLPDWGYSNFVLDFSINGGSVNFVTSNDTESHGQDIDFQIRPGHRLYRESEERILAFNSNLSLLYDYRRQETEPGLRTSRRNFFDTAIDLDLDWREYMERDFFLLFSEDVNIQYGFSSYELGEDAIRVGEEEIIDRNFTSVTQLGIGFGRVRNVNPIIRALRLRERYGLIKNQRGFTNNEIQSAAEVFTKFDGYQNRYNRPEKYFWKAMDQALNGAISGLEPFDLFYLSDVLNENIGTRLEGWDIAAGGRFNYYNSLNRDKDTINSSDPDFRRTSDISKRVGIFLQGRWYKNLSLRHQIGFTAKTNRSYTLEPDVSQDWFMVTAAQFSWLWNLTDRFLLDTRVRNEYSLSKLDLSYLDYNRSWVNDFQMITNLVYFIENRFALTTQLRYSISHEGNDGSEAPFNRRIKTFRINAGFQYYFSRHLY